MEGVDQKDEEKEEERVKIYMSLEKCEMAKKSLNTFYTYHRDAVVQKKMTFLILHLN